MMGLRGWNCGTRSVYLFGLEPDFLWARLPGRRAPFEYEAVNMLDWTAVVGVRGRSVLYVNLVFCPFTIAYLHGDFDRDLEALRLLFVLAFVAGPGDTF